jgi:hypothetical protein
MMNHKPGERRNSNASAMSINQRDAAGFDAIKGNETDVEQMRRLGKGLGQIDDTQYDSRNALEEEEAEEERKHQEELNKKKKYESPYKEYYKDG